MTKKELKKQIWDQLAKVIDPELNIDIVSMGLIYDVSLTKIKGNQYQANINMTLTTMGCPLAAVIHQLIMDALAKIDQTVLPKKKVKINLTFDPPWTPDMMSSEAKAKLKFLL